MTRRHENVPTRILHRFIEHARSDQKWWELAEKDLRKRLKTAESRVQEETARITEYEEELQYRRDHPDAER